MLSLMSESNRSSSERWQAATQHIAAAAREVLADMVRIDEEDAELDRRKAELDAERKAILPQARHLAQLLQGWGLAQPDDAEGIGAELAQKVQASQTVAVDAKLSWNVQPMNTREAVLKFVGQKNEVFGTSEIVDGVLAMGVDSQSATTRSLLSKMAKEGQLIKVGRGQYRLGNVDTTSPASSEAEVGLFDDDEADEDQDATERFERLPEADKWQLSREWDDAHREEMAEES
ncbi:type IV toxin-antitoxin system AbiEi family antitoxin domain-containing protein [Pseudonocardia tropica]|uniref:Type IV toxin-antitoxin system AbiEi family antitoxin domain-containing protein n=1 Tax=Pseudonocardia tropica TaxID=681289 RepID=A0ABV1JP75_9PSEU